MDFLRKIKTFFSKNDYLHLDLFIAFVFCLFWLFFAYQHGFGNSPDSWYRGILGKSIAQGHPYFVNIKQGFLYNYSPWHHDATHSPLLPFLYAPFFLAFGGKIIIANIIACLSAGLLVLPLLRLSRKMLNFPFSGFIIYLLSAFNAKNDFIFEVFAGLSLPTTLMLLAFSLFFIWKILEAENKYNIICGIISLSAFFYIRPGEEIVFLWLLASTLIFGKMLLAPAAYNRIAKTWLWAGMIALPWIMRNLILFKHPFFTHTTPALWTDRGYDYWTYHELIPLPTARTYFSNHSFVDFINKIFVKGAGNYLQIFGQTLSGPVWLYLLAFILSLAAIFIFSKNKHIRFLFFGVANAFIAYSAIYSIVPVIDRRYMMMPFFLIALAVISSLSILLKQQRKALIFILLIIVIFLQWDFWLYTFPKQFTFAYTTSDKTIKQDVLIKGLTKRIEKDAIILGPMADVQRLNFATGLTFIEEPDNLRTLREPIGFFRKYNIRYSLVDLKGVLPEKYLEKVEFVGDRLLYTISTKELSCFERTVFQKEPLLPQDKSISRSISAGIKARTVYIDAFHGKEPADKFILSAIGCKADIVSGDFSSNKDKLFSNGLLIMVYGQNKPEISAEDLFLIKQYIANGGRLFLLCPSWVWVSYEHKGLEDLPYNKIAGLFGIIFTSNYAEAPYKIINNNFQVDNVETELSGLFSSVMHEQQTVILQGSNGYAAAVMAKRGRAKIIAWGHNNLLSDDLSNKPKSRELLKKLINWSLEP